MNKKNKPDMRFPDNFMWGGGISAIQTEGTDSLKGKTIFDLHFELKKEKFYQGIGPGKTNDFFNKYKQDIKLFKKVGANSYRTSIMWSRIFPHNGKDIDIDGIKFYQNVAKESKKNGLHLTFTLAHSDLPMWLAEKGGFCAPNYVEHFKFFADTVFKHLVGLVPSFATFNEPWVPINGGYLGGLKWPFHKKDFKNNLIAILNLVEAHAITSHLFKKKYANQGSNLGIVINMRPVLPKDKENKLDNLATHNTHVIVNKFLCDATINGKIEKETIELLKERAEGFFPELSQEFYNNLSKSSVDFVGINFYKCQRVQGDKKAKLKTKHYSWPTARMNVFRGWEIYPKGLYDILMWLKEEYNSIPCIISENGMGVQNEDKYMNNKGIVQDTYRIAFIKEHLEWVWKAIQKGANVFGYQLWAIIDNWSIGNAYMNRYGLIRIELKDGSRSIKKSGYWFKEMTARNGFDFDYETIEETIDLDSVKRQESLKLE